MPDNIRRGNRRISEDQKRKFLDHLAETANVRAAARLVGAHVQSFYYIRDRDEAFAAAWESAITEAVDALEAEAWRRAMRGYQEPIVSMGKLVKDPQDDTKPLFVTKYSDPLMIVLLKAHAPKKFNPPPPPMGAGIVVPAELRPDPKPVPDEPSPENIIE